MKSLADVVSASGLAGYAEVALIIFIVAFIAVGLRALVTNRAALDHEARLPFDDGDLSNDDSSTPAAPRGR